MKTIKNKFSPIALLLILSAGTVLFPGFENRTVSDDITADTVLYYEVTNENLPTSIVNGPGMDVESADLDGDGDIDIVIANEYQPNRILLNDGTGKFTNATGRLPIKKSGQ